MDESHRSDAQRSDSERSDLERSDLALASAFEPGSFRDRTSRVFYQAGTVFRALRAPALANWQQLVATAFFQQLQEAGKIVHTQQVETIPLQAAAPAADPAWHTGSPGSSGSPWVATLKHQRIPVISYPYEWSFGMLKDAALLQLELLRAALAEGMILKDASSFNIQWIGSQPIFIDIPSFTPLAPGETWVGYRQFCQLFLYPLLLQAYKDIPFQPWLRGSIDGIDPQDCGQLMSVRDRLRPGVLSHVYLQAKAQARYAHTPRNIPHALRSAGFDTQLIQANVSRLTRLIQKLSWKRSQSTWSEYAEHTPYTEAEHAQKADFVRRVTQSRHWSMVWDLGCNTGTFSRIAAQSATTVVAMDVDALVIERLYQALKTTPNTTILPLVSNLADASPNLGWRGTERRALDQRTQPDLILSLALIHHMVISANIPLHEFIQWLAGFKAALVIEFITRDDPMVRTLLRHKDDHYTDYTLAYFEQCVSAAFEIIERQPLASGTRILYYAQPKT